MLYRYLFSLVFFFTVCLPAGYSASDGLKLSVGFAPSYLIAQSPHNKTARYMGLALSTMVSYPVSRHKIGVSSNVLFGQQNSNEEMILSSDHLKTNRRIQFSNFTPYFQYNFNFVPLAPKDGQFFFKLGTTSSLTSLRLRREYDENQKAIFRKTTMVGRGIDVALGLERIGESMTEFSLNYIEVRTGKPKLVDITDFTNAITLTRMDDKAIEKVQVFLLRYSLKLF